MKKYKANGRYPYHNTLFMLFAALMPLIFGGAVGPEAGLTGVIVGLCCWAGDNIKFAGKYLSDLPDIGISATLGVLFRSPLFGFIEPIEGEDGEFTLTKPVNLGWRGGSFFPSIFAGVCLGYACAMLFHIDIAFSVAIATASLMTAIMRKPLAVTVLLLICFPVHSFIYILAASFLTFLVPEFGKPADEAA